MLPYVSNAKIETESSIDEYVSIGGMLNNDKIKFGVNINSFSKSDVIVNNNKT